MNPFPGKDAQKWQYTKITTVDWMTGRRKCHRCATTGQDLYRRYVMQEGDYWGWDVVFENVYCKECIEALWAMDDLKDLTGA